jgi:hypothetical protein
MQDKDVNITSPFRCQAVNSRLQVQSLKNEATDGMKGEFSSEEETDPQEWAKQYHKTAKV